MNTQVEKLNAMAIYTLESLLFSSYAAVMVTSHGAGYWHAFWTMTHDSLYVETSMPLITYLHLVSANDQESNSTTSLMLQQDINSLPVAQQMAMVTMSACSTPRNNINIQSY